MTFGRMVRLTHGGRSCMIKRTWLTKVFVAGDAASFFIQAKGISHSTRHRSDCFIEPEADQTCRWRNKSLRLFSSKVKARLPFHLILVTALFDRKIRKRPTSQSVSNQYLWYKHHVVLYCTSDLLVLRSFVRIFEYMQGNRRVSYVEKHEFFLYIFDAVLMFGLLIIVHVVSR